MRDPADITVLVLDVDGVLTDGSIIYSDDGHEIKRFYTRDGFGLKTWLRAGFDAAVITGRGGAALARRMNEIGVKHVVEHSRDKDADLRGLCERLGVPLSSCAFVGDDWPDLAAMRLAGYAIAVADAEPAVIELADWVTPRPGGRGAVRDAVEHLLGAHGISAPGDDPAVP